jgi:hypothetical protein
LAVQALAESQYWLALQALEFIEQSTLHVWSEQRPEEHPSSDVQLPPFATLALQFPELVCVQENITVS